MVVYFSTRGCELTHQRLSACAGSFACVFGSLGDASVARPASAPTAADIAEHPRRMAAAEPYTIPTSIFDEVFRVCAQLGIG